MVFEEILDQEIEVGKPLKSLGFASKTKENFNDLNKRIEGITGTVVREVFNEFVLGLFLDNSLMGVYRAPVGINLNETFVGIVDTFADGTENLKIDILKHGTPDVSMATSIFSVTPKVPAIKGEVSQNAVLDPALSVVPGDYLFLKMVKFQANIKAFQVVLR